MWVWITLILLLLLLFLQIAEHCCLLYACIFHAWEHFKCSITLNRTPYHQRDGILPSEIESNDASFFRMLCLHKLYGFFHLLANIDSELMRAIYRFLDHPSFGCEYTSVVYLSIFRYLFHLLNPVLLRYFNIHICFIHQYLFNYSSIIVIRHRFEKKKLFHANQLKINISLGSNMIEWV